jgi:formate hydrogenlyase subunit 4
LKQLVLYPSLPNVFVAPFGPSSHGAPGSVVAAVAALLGKAIVLGLVFAVIDNLFSKLRLFKIPEFLAAAFGIAVLAVVVFYVSPA